MPNASQYTDLLGEPFLEQVDALCEEIKAQLGWPPLGQKELSPSAARSRQKDDAGILADLLIRIGPERSMALLKSSGVELLGEFGDKVVSDALGRASAAFAKQQGSDGRENYVQGGP